MFLASSPERLVCKAWAQGSQASDKRTLNGTTRSLKLLLMQALVCGRKARGPTEAEVASLLRYFCRAGSASTSSLALCFARPVVGAARLLQASRRAGNETTNIRC